jgi:hypothetical protein
MYNQFKIYCFAAYTPLNMFRALLCPTSGAPSNCLCSHWLPYDCRVGRASSCGRRNYTLLLATVEVLGHISRGRFVKAFSALPSHSYLRQ